MKVLLLDNYDSFTWNLVHYLEISGADVVVRRNDEILATEITGGDYRGLVVSPGPCTPAESGMLMPVLAEVMEKIPILGVCLGHQAIGMHFGCSLIQANEPVHGKAHPITHDGEGIFSNLPQPMQVGRYHSLVLEAIPQSAPLLVSAMCNDEIMGIRHKTLPIVGVQFHPESVLTPQGQMLINNWTAGLF